MKKSTLLTGIAMAGISCAAFAGAAPIMEAPAGPSDLLVTVPTQVSGWFVGVEGLYWKPTNSKLAYGIMDNNTDDDPTGKVLLVDPDYNLAFGVKAGYRFEGHGNDISVSYTQLNESDSDSASSTEEEENYIWTRLLHPSDSFDRAAEAEAKVKFNYEAIDLLAGQMINVGNKLSLHLATGIRYAKVNTKLDAFYGHLDEDGQDRFDFDRDKTAIVKLNSQYNGIGPRAVIDGKYKLGNDGLALVAQVGGSLLAGNAKIQDYQFLTIYNCDGDDILRTDTLTDVKQDNTFQIVPEADAKLGISYTMGDTHHVSIEAGWAVVNYFDVRNNIRFVSGTNRVFMDDGREGVYTHHITNVAFSGPYLGVTLFA